jgi:uncharacterized protein YbaP (TraB family)
LAALIDNSHSKPKLGLKEDLSIMNTLAGDRLRRIVLGAVAMLVLGIVIPGCAGMPGPAAAEIYRWRDQNGYLHFSEGPGPHHQSQAAKTDASPENTSPPQSTAASPVTTPGANSKNGLLWRISIPGRQASYLLGTIHSADHRVTRLRAAVADALDGCDRFVMEMKLDTDAFMQLGTSMMLAPDRDLEALIGGELFQRVVQAMAAHGMPEPAVRRLKPWAVIAMLNMPQSDGGQILDLTLYQRATGQGKPASGLESAGEQLAVFEGLSLQDQIELLDMTLKSLPSQPQMFEQLIKAYAADDLERLTDIARLDHEQSRSASARRFMTRLNDDRNRRMAKRIIPYLEQGNSFIAVGALHLAGPRGILALLRQSGYNTEPVP